MFNDLKEFKVVGIISNNVNNSFYKVVHKNTGKFYVLKAIDYSYLSAEKKKILLTEISELNLLTHSNIVKQVSHLIHEQSFTLYIVTEFTCNSNLLMLVNKCKSRHNYIEESYIWRVLYQIGRAIQFFSSKLPGLTILRPDIILENVFADEQGNFKLGCFTLSDCQKVTYHGEVYQLGQLILQLCTAGATVSDKLPTVYSAELEKIVSLMLNTATLNINVVLYHPVVLTRMTTNTLQQLSLIESSSDRSHSSNSCEQCCSKCIDYNTKLKQLNDREQLVRQKENMLKAKEEMLGKKEKDIFLLEAQYKEKVSKVDTYLRKKKNSKKILQTTRYEGIEGDLDSSICNPKAANTKFRTIVKLSPSKVIIPEFMKSFKKSVQFSDVNHRLLKNPRSNKENFNNTAIVSLKAQTVESGTGNIETHFC